MANAPKKGAKVLPDLTAGEATQPQVAASEATAKKRKNSNISIVYLKGNDEESKSIPADVAGVRVRINGRVDEVVKFADLPANIQAQAMAFGLNTVLRNQVNTTLNTEGADIDTAIEAFETRLAGFRDGDWVRIGEGGDGGVPLVIEAIKRAYADKGRADEGDKKYEAALEIYRRLGDDKKAKADQLAAWNKGAIAEAVERIKAERAAARLQKAMAKAGEAGLDDLLGDI